MSVGHRRGQILTVGSSSPTSPSGAGPGPGPAADLPPRHPARCRTRCRATCRRTPTGRCWPRWRTCRDRAEAVTRLHADALLLTRATGLRIGELRDLELDCVHEIAGHGAWLKVPLGKLAPSGWCRSTRRPSRSSTGSPPAAPPAGRCPTRAPGAGRLPARPPRPPHLRARAARRAARRLPRAGLPTATPHPLRHTYATALVNAGCSLQALMELLGHVSAEMSLRYGRLFDATVRDEYDRALTLAKAQLAARRRRRVLAHRRGDAAAAGADHRRRDWRTAPRSSPGWPAGTACAPPPREPAPMPTSASTARTSAPTPASSPCWARNAPTPKPWPRTPKPAAGATKPPGTAASSTGSTC